MADPDAEPGPTSDREKERKHAEYLRQQKDLFERFDKIADKPVRVRQWDDVR